MFRHLRAAVAVLALCVCAGSVLRAQKPEDQDDKDVKAYVLNEDKFQQVTAIYADAGACRKENRSAWEQMVADPSYADATLTQKAKLLDAKVPQCAAVVKKHGMDTHEYLVALDALHHATLVVLMKKRGMTIPATKAAEAISPGTLSFVESHYEEIEKWRLSLASEGK